MFTSSASWRIHHRIAKAIDFESVSHADGKNLRLFWSVPGRWLAARREWPFTDIAAGGNSPRLFCLTAVVIFVALAAADAADRPSQFCLAAKPGRPERPRPLW